MSKKKTGISYDKATPDLVSRVKEVVAEGARRRYSVSKVYAAYNAVFELRETPQSCSSCLVNRVSLLVEWLKGYEQSRAKAPRVTPDPNNPQYPEPVAGVIRIPMAEGAPIDLTPDEGVALTDPNAKGIVKYADGKAVKPGTYATAAGGEVTVQVGSRAALKPKEDLM